jgi:TRAP-type C4-dicarboxylate transport system permease large subunit
MFSHVNSSPTVTLLCVLAFLVVAGAIMEATVNVLLLTPLFLPILVAQGHDPIHFGVLMITILREICGAAAGGELAYGV